MSVPHPNIAKIISLSGLVLSLLLVSSAMRAQGTDSAITGTITDGEGLPVGGAQVTVRHLDTGRTWLLLTGSEGVYLAPSLPPGSYVIEVSAAQFKEGLTGVHLKNPSEVVLDLTLRPEEAINREDAPTLSQESGQREKLDSPPSRVTRETASRSSDSHRLPDSTEFPPVDRGATASPLLGPPVTRTATPMAVQSGGFAVQMAAFRQRKKADEFWMMLQDHGYTAYLDEAEIPGSDQFYRVGVGPFDTREEAAEVVAGMRDRLPEPLPDLWIFPAELGPEQ
jgi:cell division septation protein DedD